MVQKAYADQGGIHGSGFKDPDDMVKHIPMWKIHKKDGKVKSVALYKDREGRKRVAIASDGSDEGKKSAAKTMMDDLHHKRAHMEISGKSLSFHKKQVDIKPHLKSFEDAKAFHARNGDHVERPKHDDPEVIRHPELKDHMYTRKIGNEHHTKVMLGTRDKKVE